MTMIMNRAVMPKIISNLRGNNCMISLSRMDSSQSQLLTRRRADFSLPNVSRRLSHNTGKRIFFLVCKKSLRPKRKSLVLKRSKETKYTVFNMTNTKL